MARINNFWDVIAQTANDAATAIPEYQTQKRQFALDERNQGLRQQNWQAQQQATQNYRGAQLGLMADRNRIAAEKHPTDHPSFDQVYADILQNPGKYDPRVVQDFKEAAAERHPGPKEPQTPNFIGDISERAGKLMTSNAGIRRDEAAIPRATGLMDATGQPQYKFEATTPALTDSSAREQAYKEVAGQFPQYRVSPDSIRTGLGLPVSKPAGLRPTTPLARPAGMNAIQAPGWNGGTLDTMVGQTEPTLEEIEAEIARRQGR